ncbi:hypothetical protein INT47_012829 [Mucor saturninus]|uniref:CUE domain-containing protein n=1 Tax=Mucor saturninus TaxID=64648 RepID=A0A8H7QXT1_9FUNG|nr:hypothetical protein INT47_012829 [Mucor saturninus]
MSEHQIKPLVGIKATSPRAEEIMRGGQQPHEEAERVSQTATTTPTPVPPPKELSGDIKTLKDAFPDLDLDVIETILDSQGGNLDSAFEILLGMSDPTYKPTPEEAEGLSQLRQDEEYARRLAREGDAHYPQNNQEPQQPLFNFQEELPIIKEKVIEAGTAAKNKIMNLYNQFMAADQPSTSTQSGVLESRMGNLSLSQNQRPVATPQSVSVDLYEWDGKDQVGRNPLLSPKKNSNTSTPNDQLLSDEEFARQLARQDEEAVNAARSPPPAKASIITPPPKHTEEQSDSDNGGVTFSALSDDSSTAKEAKVSGYTVHDDEDDLDDLFDKQEDSTGDLKLKEEELKAKDLK